MSLLAELKRRNVFRVATLYAVAGWVLLQAGDLLFSALAVPPWATKLLLGLLLLGFPFALIFAWAYELTPEGLKREHEVSANASITAQTANKLNVLIVVLLVVAISFVAVNWYGHRNDALAGEGLPVATTRGAQSTGPAPGGSTQGAGTANTAQASIAVLPFVNMSDEKANEYFSDGLTEELLNVLANVPGLRVIARTSSFAYKGKDVKIADVAHDLAVDHVLEGSVRKSGNMVRITTQLIRASDSSHLWSETYDRNLDDIFAVQDEISKQVVDSLKLKLLPSRQTEADVGGTHNAKAYEAYLLGRHLMSEGGQAEAPLRAALQSFDDAITLDPGYAQAYVGKSTAQFRLASNAYDRFDIGFAEARKAAQLSLDLAPNLAEGHVALAQVQSIVDANIGAAVISARRALQLNPGSELVQRLCSGALSSLGDHPGAIRAAEAAVALDPISAEAVVNLAGVLINARRYAEAEVAARRALLLAPDRAGTPATLSQALMMQGQYGAADTAIEKEPVTWSKITGRAVVLAMRGQKDAARRELVSFQKQFKDDASYQYAQIEAQLGEKDAGLRWLENARRVHDPGLTSGINVDPLLDPLRDDARFKKLLLELGFVDKPLT